MECPHCHTQNPADAAAAFEQALTALSHLPETRETRALAEQLGMRPLVAQCRLGLGTLYRHTSRADEARVELTAAVDLYREMEMPFWLPRAETLLAELG